MLTVIQRVGGASGVASGLVLGLYFAWSAFVVPPFPSGQAFLEYAAAKPSAAFFDDWLLLLWFLLAAGLVLAFHRRLSPLAPDVAVVVSAIGLLGLLLGAVRSVFNLGRLQTLAASYAGATGPEREMLVNLLTWTDQGNVARDLALVLVAGWGASAGALSLRTRSLPGHLGWLGIVAGASVGPAVAGFLLSIPALTQPLGYLGVVLLLWMAWTISAGSHLLRASR